MALFACKDAPTTASLSDDSFSSASARLPLHDRARIAERGQPHPKESAESAETHAAPPRRRRAPSSASLKTSPRGPPARQTAWTRPGAPPARGGCDSSRRRQRASKLDRQKRQHAAKRSRIQARSEGERAPRSRHPEQRMGCRSGFRQLARQRRRDPPGAPGGRARTALAAFQQNHLGAVAREVEGRGEADQFSAHDGDLQTQQRAPTAGATPRLESRAGWALRTDPSATRHSRRSGLDQGDAARATQIGRILATTPILVDLRNGEHSVVSWTGQAPASRALPPVSSVPWRYSRKDRVPMRRPDL